MLNSDYVNAARDYGFYGQNDGQHQERTPEPEIEETLPAAYPVAHEGCFYGIAGRYALESCRQSEADPIGVLIHVITYMGAYFGNDAALHIGDVTAPPRLMPVTVGISSGGKGTSAQPAKALANSIGKALASMSMQGIQYRDGPMSSGEGLAYVVRDPSAKLDDETGLPVDPGVTDKRLMLIEEEFAAVLKASKREGNTITAAIRRLWDDGCYSPVVKNNPVTTTNAHVCFVGHVTYDELLKEMGATEYSNGFANRLLWLCVRRPKIIAIPRKMTEERMTAYTSEFVQAIAFAQKTKSLKLSSESERLWESIVPSLVKSQVMLTERARPQVLRIATIFALLDCTDIVTPAHITAALHVWDYCVGSIEFIFGGFQNEEESNLLNELRKVKCGMTKTEIMSVVYSNNIKGRALDDLLKSLETKEQIRRESRPNPSGKGRPATVFTAIA